MEQLLQHVWKYRLFDTGTMYTTDGVSFELIDPGRHNLNSGPDFFNAKIRMGDTVWAGNVEIHQSSSDWIAHRHDRNPAYDNVILNVVMRHDLDLVTTNGRPIRQFVMRIPDSILQDYEFLSARKEGCIPCAFRLPDIPSLLKADWITSLAMQRLMNKADRIRLLSERYASNWEEAFYISLCRSFGTGVNGDAFERLGRSLPFNYLLKHIDSLLQTEAFLFGQAGFLEAPYEHPYYILLQREYALLRHKFRLNPLPASCWRFFRLRPASFPHLRIATLASLLHHHKRLFSAFLEADSLDDIRKLFDVRLSYYWEKHYRFCNEAEEQVNGIGLRTIDSILINTLAPLLFAYGESTGNHLLEERATAILEELPPENNRYVRGWREVGMRPLNAFESQALLELQREYCDARKCLYCRIGHQLLARGESPSPDARIL